MVISMRTGTYEDLFFIDVNGTRAGSVQVIFLSYKGSDK